MPHTPKRETTLNLEMLSPTEIDCSEWQFLFLKTLADHLECDGLTRNGRWQCSDEDGFCDRQYAIPFRVNA